VFIFNNVLIILQTEATHIILPHNMFTGNGEEDIENVHIGVVLGKLPGIAHALARHAQLRYLTLAHTCTLYLTYTDNGGGGIRAYFPYHHTGLCGTNFKAYKDFRLSHTRIEKLRSKIKS
jgi:hypothetical protein